MRKIQLSIMMMSPGKNVFLKRSLDSLSELRKHVTSELIIVDTGCNEDDRKTIDAYADRVVEFAWCNDFAAARNAGLKECVGEWVLFLDDDEWFEDTKDIEQFFFNGTYLDYDAAMYVVRNYYTYRWDSYQDVYKKRMTVRNDNTYFEGAVHEQLLPVASRIARIPSYVHHFGYIQENDNARIRRGYRNITIMHKMLQQKPNDLHLRIQMAQEYEFVDEYHSLEQLCADSLKILDGQDYETYLYRGGFCCGHAYALEMMGRYEDCLKACTTYLSQKCSKLTQVTLYRWMAAAAYRLREVKICREAIEAYRKLITEYQSDSENFMKEDMLLTRNAVAEGVQQAVAQIEALIAEETYSQSELDIQRVKDYAKMLELEASVSEEHDLELLELYSARRERTMMEQLCNSHLQGDLRPIDGRYLIGYAEALFSEYRTVELQHWMEHIERDMELPQDVQMRFDYIRGKLGMDKKDIVLSISIMTPGNNPYLQTCLKSLQHIRESIPSELVVVDTGCEDPDRAMIGAYADKVVDFTWCDDFAAARNAGLDECHGKWFLYLDDDEYLVDDQPLLEFLQSDASDDVVYATFPLYNFVDESGSEYRRGSVARLYRRTEQTRFLYRIHEGIPTALDAKRAEIPSPIGHFGYIFHNDEELHAHAKRNIRLLTEALEQEEMNNMHLVSQLVHEYQIIDDYERQVAVCEAYYKQSESYPKERAILACGWVAGLVGAARYEDVLRLAEGLRKDNLAFESAIATIDAYAVIAAYHIEDYVQALSCLRSYEDAYVHAKSQPDVLAQEFFTRNGLESEYHVLVMQIGLLCALKLRDDEMLLKLVDSVPWQDDNLHIYDDLPRVLCEIIETNAFSDVVAAFLEQLLQVDSVKNAVLTYRLNTLQGL